MKIQEASKDFIKGGFPSSKTSYIEENTSTTKKKGKTTQKTYWSAQEHRMGREAPQS